MCKPEDCELHTALAHLKVSPLKSESSGFMMLSLVLILLLSLSYLVFSSAHSIITFNRLDKLTQQTSNESLSARQATRELAKSIAVKPLGKLLPAQHSHKFVVNSFSYKGAHELLVEQFSIATSSLEGALQYKESFVKYPSILALPNNTKNFDVDSSITEKMFNRTLESFSHGYLPSPLSTNNCNDLQTKVVIWIEGNCLLTAKSVKHSSAKNPILLVVKNGDITFEENTTFYGLLIIIPSTSNTNKVVLHPSAKLTGLAISTHSIATDIQGTTAFSFDVLQQLQQHAALFKIIPIPGTAYEY